MINNRIFNIFNIFLSYTDNIYYNVIKFKHNYKFLINFYITENVE